MDAARFDHLTRSLTSARSRRQTVLAMLLGGVLTAREAADIAAGPGCKNVGVKCKKKSDCCSGVCKGKKKKKKCRAHDTGGCKPGQQEAVCGGEDVLCTTVAGLEGVCDTTTGNAGYCTSDGGCFACQRDADCRSFCGPKAACIRCADECADVGGTACVGPAGCDVPSS
jgi:hypothetical protein